MTMVLLNTETMTAQVAIEDASAPRGSRRYVASDQVAGTKFNSDVSLLTIKAHMEAIDPYGR